MAPLLHYIDDMLARVNSSGLSGIDASPVTVEVDLAPQGLPGWHFVGLPEAMVRESKDRVASALRNSGYSLRNRKTTINLAPAHRRKQGNFFDLPIAVGLMVASEILSSKKLSESIFVGELSLSGDLHPIKGAISIAQYARNENKTLVLPSSNQNEINCLDGLSIVPVDNLSEVIKYFNEEIEPELIKNNAHHFTKNHISNTPDLSDVRGQLFARRALEIAAAGAHHIIFIGPPGAGKTMLASRLPGLLPQLTNQEIIETLSVYSAAGETLLSRPFRDPHHSASAVGILGSTNHLGEISLAHNGVLFLDEFPEFRRDVIESLREPLESGFINIVRAGDRISYPAKFQCVAACNPCKCGYYNHPTIPCTCSISQLQNYRSKLSGPVLNRIDLHVSMEILNPSNFSNGSVGENTEQVRERVLRARSKQVKRYKDPHHTNANVSAEELQQAIKIAPKAEAALSKRMSKEGYSARAYIKVLRIAQTIADLSHNDRVEENHIHEALQFRALDKPL